MATQGDKIKYRGYAYVKGKAGGDIDEGKVREIINTYIVQDTGSATDKLMSQEAVTKAIQDTDVGSLKTRMDTAEKNIITNATNILNNTNNITNNTTNIEVNKQSIIDEGNARKTADTTLQTNIDNEATTREAQDKELLGKINVNKGNIDIVNNSVTVLQDKVNTHISEYEENIRMIQTQITNEATTRNTKDSDLEAKIASLQANIKVEVVDSEPPTPENNTMYFIKTATGYSRKLYNNDTWYDMGDTEIDLSNYYTKAETYTQEQIDDKDTFIKNEIATEKTTRANADTTLLNNINTEITSRTNADNTLQENIDKKQDKLTAKDGIKLENNELSVDLTTIVDKLYPIGYVLVANQAPGLGTWTDITDSYSNRYLRLGSYGELSDEALPVPDLTIDNAGNHTHERGTMEITGNAGAFVCDASSYISGTGAFYVSGTPRTRSWSGASGNEIRSFGFKASNSWTGATSENGEHTHTISATAGGVYQDGAAVQPLGFGIRIFQRTA